MVNRTTPVENVQTSTAEELFEKSFRRLENACKALKIRNQSLEEAGERASKELGLHIRNLGRILGRQE